MNREKKNVLIWLMFGIYFGTFLARAISNYAQTGIWDWILILAGIVVVIIHYSPDKN